MWQELLNRTLVGPVLSTDELVNIHGWMDAHDVLKWRSEFNSFEVNTVVMWASKMWQHIS